MTLTSDEVGQLRTLPSSAMAGQLDAVEFGDRRAALRSAAEVVSYQ